MAGVKKFAAVIGLILPDLVRDLAGLAGAALTAYGAWLVYDPAGYIAGGILLLAGAMLSSRKAAGG